MVAPNPEPVRRYHGASSDPASQYFQALHEVMTPAGGDSAVMTTQSLLEHLCNLVRKEKTKQFYHSENEGVTQEGQKRQTKRNTVPAVMGFALC